MKHNLICIFYINHIILAFVHVNVTNYAIINSSFWSLSCNEAQLPRLLHPKSAGWIYTIPTFDTGYRLHDCINNRDLFYIRKNLSNLWNFWNFWGNNSIHLLYNTWFILTNAFCNGIGTPYQYTCIPKIIASNKIFLCCFKVWLLLEFIYAMNLLLPKEDSTYP